MNPLEPSPKKDELEAMESIRRLIRAGVQLGVAEAVRRATQFLPAPGERVRRAGAETVLGAASVVELLQFVRNDPNSIFQLAKEVWSRGGPKEKEKAAEAVGRGLGFLVPHRALDAARALASMARSGREADLVGRRAIGPVLERAPPMADRVKKMLTENERLIRQAAIAGLVAFVIRKKKYAAMGAEIILLVAEEHEKEIRDAVKWGLARIMEADPKATAKAVGDWARSNPTADRVQAASQFLKRKAGDLKLVVERGVVGTVARFTNGGKQTEAPARTRGRRPRKPTTSAKR